jgi:hypothetical protein
MPDRNPPPAHPDVRYEISDARGGAIIALGVLLVLLGLIVQASAGWLFDCMKEREQRKYQALPSLAAKERIHLPRHLDNIPQPRLQEVEPLDLAKLRNEEDAKLITFGWVVDRETGIERIPDEVVQRLVKSIRVRSLKESKK